MSLPKTESYSYARPAEGLSPAALCAVFLLVLCLLFSRRPSDLFHAQFYAEDGKRWFAQAYNLHWLPSLLVPDAGYLHLLARLLTGPALLVPMVYAPLWMNCAGAIIQALPVVFLLSSRCSAWGSLHVRLALALIYLACPNFGEIHVMLTNAQWHLCFLQVLLAFSRPPGNRVTKGLDVVIFLLGSFTGPFDLMLLPVLLLFYWRKREPWTLVLLGCITVGSIFQSVTLLTGTPFGLAKPEVMAGRSGPLPLGVSFPNLLRLLGGTLFLDSLTGYIDPTHLPRVTPVIFLLFGIVIVVCGLRLGPPPLRYFALFTLPVFVASLRSPLVDQISPWQAMASGTGGVRYFFLPGMVFLWSAVYAFAASRSVAVRGLAAAAFLLLATGLRHWEYARPADHHFAVYVQRLDQLRAGQDLNIPIYPDPWFMTLRRR